MTKVCSQCGEEKTITEYHKSPSKGDGLRTCCKACRRKYAQIYYAANRDSLATRHRRYRESVWGKFKILTTDAARREHEMTLSIDQASALYLAPCHYCKKTPEQIGRLMGIDRWDPAVGYIWENCRPACGCSKFDGKKTGCNYTKAGLHGLEYQALVLEQSKYAASWHIYTPPPIPGATSATNPLSYEYDSGAAATSPSS